MSFQWLRDTEDRVPGDRPTRSPLSVYVLWHPGFKYGPELARAIGEWCGGGVDDMRAVGLGIPVHFRSEDWHADNALSRGDMPELPGSLSRDPIAERARREQRWRRPIELNEARMNVFVPIVDEHMVEDPSWRRDLIDLAALHDAGVRDKTHRVHVAPIQMHSAWARMPSQVSRIQALHLRRWTDNPNEPDEDRRARWSRQIRRLLTQALVRLLRTLRDSALPAEVFLSHAKVDRELGPGVAEKLRDVAAGYGQIEVFYDENDLPSGADWQDRMETSAADSAGFIAVLSDRYATRYWCRREIQLARTPVRVTNPRGTELDPADLHIWIVRPSVVAVTLAGAWSRLIGELGTVPAIRWDPDNAELAATILDQLFREALVSEFQRMYARMLQRKLIELLPEGARPPIAYVTWTPDAATLLRLQKQLHRSGSDEERARWAASGVVVYPGHGFLPTDEEELAGSLGPNVRFLSFEQLSDVVSTNPALTWEQVYAAAAPDALPPEAAPAPKRPVVALSVGDADDLATLGYDAGSGGRSLHVDTAVLRLCRVLLRSNVRIAYGGRMPPPNAAGSESSFAVLLRDTAVALAQTPGFRQSDRGKAEVDPETPLEMWIPRPYGEGYPVATRADLTGLCRFYFVGDGVPADASPEDRAAAVARARSEGRRVVANHTAMAICLSGKRWGFSGIMPGIAEELLCATEAADKLAVNKLAAGKLAAAPGRVRVLLLGEFGGVTREIVRYIIGATKELPPALVLEAQEAHPSSKLRALLEHAPDLRPFAEQRYAALASCLGMLREVARRDDNVELPLLGISVRAWKDVMITSSIGHVRRLLRRQIVPVLRARAAQV
jgi:hypothetical protein